MDLPIDDRPSEASAALHAIIDTLHRRCADAASHVIWLAMDASLHPLPEIDAFNWTARPVQQVRLEHPQIDASWWPTWYALDLDKAVDCLVLEHSVDWAMAECCGDSLRSGLGRRVAGWLVLQGQASEAARHWGACMVQRQPADGRGAALLRLHDPSVLWSFWQVLQPRQKAQWLGPVRTWSFLDPFARLTALDGPSARATADGLTAQPTTSSTPLTAAQWQQVDHTTAFNHALRAVLEGVDSTAGLHLDVMFRDAMQALQRAQRLGIDDAHDLDVFAERALTQHAQFDTHPDIARLLREREREPDQPLGGLFADLTPAHWQRISADLSAPRRSANSATGNNTA